ncbi:MAG: nickel ABC transporter permease [Thermomicrobiales bacterium]
MASYFLRRSGDLIVTLFGVSIVIFMIIRLVPGDPARLIVGTEATQADVVSVRRQLGLDKPLPVQYLRYLKALGRGDLGRSLLNRQPVTALLRTRLPNTLVLASASMIVTLVIGLGTGMLAAIRRGSLIDTASMIVALIGVSMPGFWLGLMLIFFFAVRLGWLPTSGTGGIKHLILPAITLGVGNAAIIARLTRANLLEVLHQEFVRTARAKGLRPRSVLIGHALRNAMIPTLTLLGLQWGALLAGSVVIETVFAWPGVGRLLVDSVAVRDYPVIQACVLLFALIFMVTNLVVDVAYAFLDPRIRYD